MIADVTQIPASHVIILFSEDDDEHSEHSSPNVSNSLLNPNSILNRMSPGGNLPPSGSPSAGLPGMPTVLGGQANQVMVPPGMPLPGHDTTALTNGMEPQAVTNAQPQENGTGEGTPESADSPIQRNSAFPPNSAAVTSHIPTLASVQSTIEKTFSPGVTSGLSNYTGVEFSHSPISAGALWPTGWPQHAYYKQ